MVDDSTFEEGVIRAYPVKTDTHDI